MQMTTKEKTLMIDGNTLAKRWGMTNEVAQNTVKSTTQNCIRSAIHPIECCFRTKNTTLKYNHLSCRFYSDTFFAQKPSLLQNTCAQLFVSEFGYLKFCPQKRKSEAPYSLQELIRDVGIPSHMHTDGAKEMTMGDWKRTCQEAGIKMTHTENRSPWQNRTEVEIRELKRHVRRLMSRSRTPHKLWDFCCMYATELRNRLARPLPQLHGRTPYEMITGNTPDISEFLEFEWYQPVWYFEPTTFPDQVRHLARWIGVAHRVGQAMCYWLLPKSGIPIARTTVQALSEEELMRLDIQEQIKDYDEVIKDKLS